jgi:hypothetical protein
MSNFKGILRPTEKDNTVCRGCDKKMLKGDDIVVWYSSCNRGMNIILCLDCCKVIGGLFDDRN